MSSEHDFVYWQNTCRRYDLRLDDHAHEFRARHAYVPEPDAVMVFVYSIMRPYNMIEKLDDGLYVTYTQHINDLGKLMTCEFVSDTLAEVEKWLFKKTRGKVRMT